MKFQIARDALLKPLTLVAGVVERRQTLPILANVRLRLAEDSLSLTGTDLEVELVGRVPATVVEGGEVTVPARKLLDICKALPEGSEIAFTLKEDRLQVVSARSRFTLSTLPASDFPGIEESAQDFQIRVPRVELRRLIERTAFAMAQQDVRYYLNGMLWEVSNGQLRVVATDGHRLALCVFHAAEAIVTENRRQLIVPRKGVLELQRLLQGDEGDVSVVFGKSHIRVVTDDFAFTSKLVDGKFPDYERVLPKGGNRQVDADRQALRHALGRASILSNEKYRGVRLVFSENQLQILANNPEQEESEETVAITYAGGSLEIGFNVGYLLDVLSVLGSETVRMTLGDSNSSALVEGLDEPGALFVVMPMRL